MRLLVCALLALSLAGCITASNTLSPDQVSGFRLAGIQVTVPESASVRWGEGEAAYAASKGVPAHEAGSVVETREGRASIRGAVAAKLRAALERELAGRLVGGRPVRLLVNVRDVEIASPLQRILIGGHHNLRADTTLVDARTGAVLLAFTSQAVGSMAGQGILGTIVDAAALPAPIDRVVSNYAAEYRAWLLRG